MGQILSNSSSKISFCYKLNFWLLYLHKGKLAQNQTDQVTEVTTLNLKLTVKLWMKRCHKFYQLKSRNSHPLLPNLIKKQSSFINPNQETFIFYQLQSKTVIFYQLQSRNSNLLPTTIKNSNLLPTTIKNRNLLPTQIKKQSSFTKSNLETALF